MAVKDAVKKARVCFVAALPVVFFLAGIAWVLLFPAVSITTGELKPRGMYVDEHSLLVQSGIVGKPAMVPVNSIIDSSNICGALDRSKLRCSYAPVDNVNESSIIQIEITPRHAKTNFDSTVLVFRYNKEPSVQNEVMSLVSSVAAELTQSRWNTRKVIILLLPTSNNTQNNAESAALQSWLQRHHKPTFEQIIQSELHSHTNSSVGGSGGSGDIQYILQVGTIREAYIFDLTDPTIWPDATSIPNTDIPNNTTTTIATTTPNTPHTLHFTFATLLHTGADGLLPNMDLIAYPLSLYPRILQTESQVCGDGLYVYLQNWYDGASVCCGGSGGIGSYNSVCSIVESVARHLLPLIQTIDYTLPHAYKHRLLSLLCTVHTLSTNTATGLHGYFSHLNIDSITIKPTFAATNTANIPMQGRKQKKRPSTSTGSAASSAGGVEKYDISTLLEMVMSCVYVSNNLQEELHHSHFYNLTMGSGHFVGINEYGFTAALFLASVLCMFVQLCGVHSAGNRGTAGPVSGSVVGEKSSMRQCTGDGVAKTVFGAVLMVVVLVVWVICVPMVYGVPDTGFECSAVSGSGTGIYNAFVSGHTNAVLPLVGYVLHYVRMYVVYNIPKERVAIVTLALCGVACVSALLGGGSSKKCVVNNASDSSGEANGVSCGSGSVADGGENDDANNANTTQLVSTDHTSPGLCVYTLFLLVTLAYVFAFNFSLGLALAMYTVPCMRVVTYICLHCAGSVGIVERGMSMVLLAVVMLCSVFVMNCNVVALNSSAQVVWVLVSLLVGLSVCTVLGRVLNFSK